LSWKDFKFLLFYCQLQNNFRKKKILS
jgi:hypothetical protein